MAFAVEAYSSVNSFGASTRRPGPRSKKTHGILAGVGVIGTGILALGCVLATLAGMHSIITPAAPESRLEASLRTVAPMSLQASMPQRLIRVSKFSRLRADQSEFADLAARRVARETVVAALKPKLMAAEATALRIASLKSSLIERGPMIVAPVAVAAADAQKAKPEKLGPAHGEPAAPTLASAAGPLPTTATALVETIPAAEGGALPKPFNLVLGDSIPLPVKRPGVAATLSLAPKKVEQQPKQMLAYASPKTVTDDSDDEPLFGRTSPAPIARGKTAIYDIAAATVYLPSGEKLEAHSGIGPMRDNPRYVKQKNRGPTPPHTYVLTMREALFHGVAALRLTPLDPSAIHGRDGILAHTYMLGPRGDSNGCVVFKDYKRFLAAFKRGEVNRIVVVASSSARPFGVAMR